MKQIGNIMSGLKSKKVWQMMFYDVFAIGFTYGLAIVALELTSAEGFDYKETLIILPIIILFKLIIYLIFKVYKFVLDNAGFEEVFRIGIMVILTNSIIIAITLLGIPHFEFIPEIYFVFVTALEVFIMALPRIINRLVRYVFPKRVYMFGKRTLLIGAGAGGKLVLDEIRNNPALHNNPIAFIDDDEEKIGNIMSGFSILGPIKEIPKIITNYKIEEVIICIANIEDTRLQEIIEIIAEKPVKIKRLPKFKSLQTDRPKKLLDVNVEDLLSREVVKLDTAEIESFIKGKKVLVTGAGGSIGSELVRQIISNSPKKILLFDIYENGVYDLQTELNHLMAKKIIKKVEIIVQIGSVYNNKRVEEIFKSFRPNLVFHAAAYKHVPLMESSSKEAIRTNVIGTNNVARMADKYNIEKLVLVSSDKAVRPTNVMGATKRFAEMIIQSRNSKSETSYSAVRFGNVLGSNGSVVPLFRKQIENGGPVTVTDKRIIRYFMTIPEAVGLILQSATYAKGGEIFILDMGDPVKIYDLAEKMIKLSGMRPHVDIKIDITGLRPGEKLFEELLVNEDDENIQTSNEKIFIEKISEEFDLEADIQKISETFEDLNNCEIKELLNSYIPSYTIKRNEDIKNIKNLKKI